MKTREPTEHPRTARLAISAIVAAARASSARPLCVLAAVALTLTLTSTASAKEAIAYFGTEVGSGTLGGEFNSPGDVAVNASGAGPERQGLQHQAGA